MAGTALGLAGAIGDLGMGQAFIQRQGDIKAIFSSAFTLQLLLSIIVASVLATATPWIAEFYKEPALKFLLLLIAVGYFVRAIALIHEAALRKTFRYKTLQVILLVANPLYGVTAILLALNGARFWSFAVGYVATQTAVAVLLWRYAGIPVRLSFDKVLWKDLIGFGRFVFLGSIIWNVLMQADKMVAGRALGASSLGFYVLAYTYGRMPLSLLGSAMGDVLFSGFSRVQKDMTELRRLLLKSIRILSFVAFPTAVIFVLSARDLITFFVGEKWSPAIVPFQILSFSFSILLITAPYSPIFLATNRPSLSFVIGLGVAPLLALCLWCGLPFGVVGIALGVTTTMLINGLAQTVIVGRILGVEPLGILKQCISGAISSVFAALLGVGLLAITQNTGAFFRLLALPFFIALVFLVFLKIVYPSAWNEISTYVPKRFIEMFLRSVIRICRKRSM